MEKFDIYVLGCGAAIPTVRHNPTSQIIDLRDKLFMIDCAEGTQLQMRKAKLGFSRLNHIFISHLHGDHCFGLMGLLSTFDLLGRIAPLHIYSPGEDLERLLRPQIEYFCRYTDFKIHFHALDWQTPTLAYEDRSVKVSTIPLKHRVPCCGYLFEEKALLPKMKAGMVDFLKIPYYAIKTIKEGGNWTDENGRIWTQQELTAPPKKARRYAYCSDTIYLPELHQQLRGVDLLYHEATYCDDGQERAQFTFHSTAKQAAQVAKDAAAQQLMIGHFSARYENEKTFLHEAQSIFPNTFLANEGLKISL